MRFFIFFIFFILLAFIFWTLLIAAQSNNPTRMSQWVHDAYEKKQLISQRIKEKKIILLAGSNILFGVDSQTISQAFNMPVLNYGINAGIELPYTLEAAKKIIHPGDRVLMPLEYPMYSYDGTPGVQMIDYIFSRDAGYFWKLSFKEQLHMLLHMEFKRVLQGFLCPSEKKIDKGLYGAHHIDIHGDQINTHIKFQTQEMRNQIKTHALNPEKYSQTFDPDAIGWHYITDFIDHCKNLDVPVIFMPSTLMKHDSFYTDAKEKWFYENIAGEVRKRGWTFVGNPQDYMYDRSLYFNTNFHLTERGKAIRTRQMIRDLKNRSWLNGQGHPRIIEP